MFRAAPTLLTLVALVVHSVLGCCNHAVHACEADLPHLLANGPERDACGSGAGGCCRGMPAQQSEPEQHPEPKHCHEETCSFTTALPVKLPTPFEAALPDVIPCDAFAPSSPVLEDRILRTSEGFRRGVPLTVRAQLWLQSWLI